MKYVFKKDSFVETYNSPRYFSFICLDMCNYENFELQYDDMINFVYLTIVNNELISKNGYYVTYNNLKRELEANYKFLILID